MKISGQEGLTINLNNKAILFKVKNIAFENLNIKGNKSNDEDFVIDTDNTLVTAVQNCTFDGVSFSLNGKNIIINSVSNSKFLNNGTNFCIGTDAYANGTIATIEGCTFAESDHCIYHLKVNKISGCDFYSRSPLVSNTIESVTDCNFYGRPLNNSTQNIISIEGTTINETENCTFDTELHIAYETNLKKVGHCTFKNISYSSNTNPQIGTISNSTFTSDKILIQGDLKDLRLVQDTFSRSDYANTFVLSTSTPGYYSQNIVSSPKNFSSVFTTWENKNDLPTPENLKVAFSGDDYILTGTAEAGSVIEVFLNKGTGKNAVKYIGKTTATSAGQFTLKILGSAIGSESPVFIATATIKDHTSDLSDASKINLRKEVYVKLSGKGNGSSWSDAMSPEDFAKVLPFAEDGTSFYVAAGTYDLYKLSPYKEAINGTMMTLTDKSVYIYGGYTVNPKENEEADPSNNATIFTSSQTDPSSVTSFVFTNDVALEGINFKNVNLCPLSSKYNFASIFKCKFESTIDDGRSIIGIKAKAKNLNVINNIFTGNYTNAIYSEDVKNPSILNNTFNDLTCSNYLIKSDYAGNNVEVTNNTFVNVDCKILLYSQCHNNNEGSTVDCSTYGKDIFINNTVLKTTCSLFVFSSKDLYSEGNIYNTTKDPFINTNANNLKKHKSLHDFLSCPLTYEETDSKVIKEEDLQTVLEYEDGVPVLAQNGGFSPTVRVIKDLFPDGTSIRIDRPANLYSDQRYTPRALRTCAGAYEAPFSDLNFFGTPSIKDNTCSAPNSKVTIKIAGWDKSCIAALNNKVINPTSVDGEIALFEFNGLEGGEYKFDATKNSSNLSISYTFKLSTAEEPDLKKLAVSTEVRRPICLDDPDGFIWVDFKGNKAGTELTFIAKGDDEEDETNSTKAEGTVSFKEFNSGKYEIFVLNKECSSDTVKIAEAEIPEALKMAMDIDNAIIKNATCVSKYGSIFLPIHNFTQGENQLIINNVTADGVDHGMYGYQYAKEKKDNVFEQLYYTSESVLDDNKCYDVVYYECQLSPGHYKIEAQQCGNKEYFEFDVKNNSSEPIDLSNISASVEVERPVCFDKPDGSIWLDFEGNNTGTKVTFTAKGEGNEDVTSSTKENGSVSFRSLASGKYEIFASINYEKCNAPEVKIAEAEIPEALKMTMDIDNAIIKNATCVSKYGSIFLPIHNFTQGENQLIINNVTSDGVVHGMYGYQYVKEKKSNAFEQLYYTSESVLDDNNCYDVVYYECQLSSGHYKIEAQQCGKTEYFEFDVKPYKPVDLSNVELNLTDSRQTCAGVDNAQVQIGYSNIPEGETIELTIKSDNYSKTYSNIKGNGYLLFYDVPVGEYDVLVEAENDECAEPISLGKFAVNSIKKPRMESAGLSIDEKIVDGQGRKIFHLVISNYLKKNEVTVYHEGEPIRKFVEPVETTDGNPSDKLNFHYTSECPVKNGLFDFVFLDWGNAKSGHYKVEIKDKCDQIVEFEFDIDDCTPLDLSNLDAKIYATRQQCSGIDNGGIQISYSGNVEGQKLKFTIKNGDFEKSYNVEKEARNLLYHDVPAGTYEIFVSPEEAETLSDCPFSTKSLGKVTVAETKKPSMSSPGLVIDESKNYISLLIRNYMNKDIVDVYRDDELVARFNVATEGKNDSRNTDLFYTEDCGKNGDNFDFVFLDLDNAQSGHYLVQVKDQCNQTVEFEFDAKFPTTGVEVTTNDDELVDVYNVLGICMKRGVKRSEALNGLKQGVYIVGNEQVYKSAVK